MIRAAHLFFVFSIVTAQIGYSQETITALNMNPDWVGINGWAHYVGSNAAGQEFTATTSGRLTRLEASVDKFYGNVPLDISFYTSDGGFPGTILGTVSVPAEDFVRWGTNTGPMNHFDVSGANVEVEAGQNYVIVFTAEAAGVQYRCIMTAPNANSFGYPYLESRDGSPWVKMTRLSPNVEIGIRLFAEEACVEHLVEVDVLPESVDNVVQLGKKRPKPFEVVVYGNEEVDVVFTDTETLNLGDPTIEGGDTVAPYDVQLSDTNGDGFVDLVLQFDLTTLESSLAIDSNSTGLELKGELINCDTIYGIDIVQIKSRGKGNGKGNGKGKNR